MRLQEIEKRDGVEVVKLVGAQLDFPIAKGSLMQEPDWKLKFEGRRQSTTRL